MSMNESTDADSPRPRVGRVDREHQWRQRLAIATSSYIVVMSLTGLSIWLLPFSVANQIQVMVHTLVGVVMLLPVSWYTLRHWLVYRRHQLTHIKLLGYIAVFALLICNVSGLVLTLQALFGTAISYAWDMAHIVTTVGVLAFLVPHIVLIVFRERRALHEEIPGARAAVAAHWRGVGAVTLTAVAAVGLLVYAYQPPRLLGEFPADYSFKYGPDRPFAPSMASTTTGGAYDSALLAGSEGCGTSGCHSEILAEWQVSAHRYSAMDAAFQAIQLNMAQQNGPESTRYCGGCHDPISLFSGTKNLFTDSKELTNLAGYNEGVSCLSCHAVREVDVKGNADYQVGHPSRYMFEMEYDADPRPTTRLLRDFLIRAYPQEHVASLSKTLFKTPEYCAACHKQFVDEEINNVGWVQLQNQYDNWKNSRWNHPDEPTRTVECRECHMPLVASTDPAAGDASDYNRSSGDGKHRSHRFLGANQMMPAVLQLPGWEEHVGLVEKWLRGEIEIPEIADKWQAGAAVGLELIVDEAARAGEALPIRVVITSNKVGHDFPTGPLDIIQSWVELIVRDDAGNVVYESGTVGADGFIQPGSFMFKAEPVDQQGNLIDRHNLWEMVGVRHRRALFPGFSDTAEYEVMCPDLRRVKQEFPEAELDVTVPEGSAALRVEARLLYRKADQYLLNFIFGEEAGLRSPVTEMASVERTVRIEPRSSD
jgi:hypothetical protein